MSFTLRQSVGASATGGVDALLGQRTLAGLDADDSDESALRHLEMRIGYLPARGTGTAQGFTIVQNRSGSDVDVDITAWDDEGTSYGPTRVTVSANAVFGFNTTDLEEGSTKRPMDGVGDGEGHWRLTLRTRGDIAVKPYARVPGGFVTALAERAPTVAHGRTAYRVDFFNPASNRSARSILRLVNPHAAENDVTITAIDALGEPGESEVTLTLPPRASVHLSSIDLEEGNQDIAGALGDGEGKWRLTVEGTKSLYAMSLLLSPAPRHRAGAPRSAFRAAPDTAARGLGGTRADATTYPDS